jgi:hypothetical protein
VHIFIKVFGCLCLIIFPEDHSIGPVEQVRSKKPWSGRSKLPAVQPLWLNFRPLSVSRIAWHTCIKQRHWQTFWGIIHVDQAPWGQEVAITKLKWDASTLTDIPGNTAHWFFAFFWLTKGSRNKPWSGRSKLPAEQPLWLNFRPLSVSRIAWHTCIIPQNVCTCLCSHCFFAFFWLTEGSRNKN